jgi:hypothetical protein
MRKSISVTCLFILVIGVLIGCQSADKKNETSSSSFQANAANAAPPAGEKQYRAVCIEKAEHGGNEYVLSKWMDNKDKANELGQYHGDFKYKGHRWRIDERVKPEQAKN